MKRHSLMRLFVLLFVALVGPGLLAPHAAEGEPGTSVGLAMRTNPLLVEVDAPGSVVVGRTFRLSARVTNLEGAVFFAFVWPVVPRGITVTSNLLQLVGPLGGGTTGSVTWTAVAADSGAYVLAVQASALELGTNTLLKSDDAVLVTAIRRSK